MFHHPKLIGRWVDRLQNRIEMYGEYVGWQWLNEFMRFNEVDKIAINRELHRRTITHKPHVVTPEPENN